MFGWNANEAMLVSPLYLLRREKVFFDGLVERDDASAWFGLECDFGCVENAAIIAVEDALYPHHVAGGVDALWKVVEVFGI